MFGQTIRQEQQNILQAPSPQKILLLKASEQVKNISQFSDGTYAFKGEYDMKYNEGSSLERTAILFNISSCPIQIVSNEICFIDGRDSFSFQAWTKITIDKEKFIQINLVQ